MSHYHVVLLYNQVIYHFNMSIFDMVMSGKYNMINKFYVM